ncbi:copper homeostasis protein CutC [Leifsonia sp. YAF41]|uniref:copper homeostasis protein CutC n=1 Tax=Leifsonia sp. YAF41 TaxID=3233086 RepID=UPI003F9CBDC6
MPSSAPAIEIAVQDVDGLGIALRAGADRVELCSALGLGGLTPSIGTIEMAVEAASAAGHPNYVNVLVRPRAGGFVYSASEVATTVRDIRAASAAGVGGIVVGALNADGTVDTAATREFIAAAEGLTVTFHRAIDIGTRQLQILDQLIDLGVARVLTSGGAPRSLDGGDMLRQMAQLADGRLQIMAGGGVTLESIPALLATGIDAIHLSAKKAALSLAPSGPGGGAADFDVTDEELARAAVNAVRSTLEK